MVGNIDQNDLINLLKCNYCSSSGRQLLNEDVFKMVEFLESKKI